MFRGVVRVAASEPANEPSCAGRGVLRNYILTYNYNIYLSSTCLRILRHRGKMRSTSLLGCVFALPLALAMIETGPDLPRNDLVTGVSLADFQALL